MQISTGFASWQRYSTALYSSGRQPNFAALNIGRHLYSAGRPSHWALAHILVLVMTIVVLVDKCIQRLHVGKASGPDDLSSEHLKYAHAQLCSLFRTMVIHGSCASQIR